MNIKNNPRGSTWKKWDLHIHTPASHVWKGTRDYERVIKKINKSHIDAYVITDYWTLEGYKELINTNDQLAKEDQLKKTVFPGIELRFDILTDENKQRVHFQVVLSNEGTKEEVFGRIDQLYSRIKLSNTKKTISKQSFIEIAKGYTDDPLLEYVGKKKDECSDDDFWLAGLKSCDVSYECLINILKDKDLSEKLLIIAPWDKYGGISKIDSVIREDKKKKLTKIASCIESTKKENINLFLLDRETLANKTWANSWRQFLDNKQKPCVSGSDAHEISDYGKSFCWIKSDLTFEGLKQIVYEPKDRVKIQPDNPYSDRNKVFFSHLKIEGRKNYVLPNIEIPLNRELITLIGGRGSGKSALLESIAFLNEEHIKKDPNEKEKIIEYYRRNIDNKEPPPTFTLLIELTDKDNKKEEYSKSLEDEEILGLPFLYIGQEQLSILATNDRELTETICELIDIDFSELEQNDLKDRARNILTDIENLEAEIQDIYSKHPEYKNGNFDTWIADYIEKKEDQRSKLSSKTTKDLLEKINEEIDRELKLDDHLTEVEKLSLRLKDIDENKQITEINRVERSIYGERAILLPLIKVDTLESAINTKILKIKKEIGNLRESIQKNKKQLADSGLKEDIGVLMQATRVIQREINNAIKDKILYKQKNKTLLSSIKSRNQIYRDVKQRMMGLKKGIDKKFTEFKKSRKDSSSEEKKLFTQIIQGVDIEGAIVFDQETFCRYILDNCLDKRSIRNEEELKAVISKRTEKGQAKDITLDSLKTWIETELDMFIKSDVLSASGVNNLINYIFINWDKFIAARSVVKLNGVPTERLSVGQRGTLLLKIYLGTATARQIFIVDQPEDNLDNLFIMNELVPLIREVKKSRQVILSTHNANLVVNADSEQVVVARLDDEGDYIHGSIENPAINQSIKEVLEGGEEAFLNREKKYGMKPLYV